MYSALYFYHCNNSMWALSARRLEQWGGRALAVPGLSQHVSAHQIRNCKHNQLFEAIEKTCHVSMCHVTFKRIKQGLLFLFVHNLMLSQAIRLNKTIWWERRMMLFWTFVWSCRGSLRCISKGFHGSSTATLTQSMKVHYRHIYCSLFIKAVAV